MAVGASRRERPATDPVGRSRGCSPTPVAAEGGAESVATVRQSTGTELLVEKDSPQDAMQEIIGNAMKAVDAQRWMSADPAQPSTVELWVRIFRVHIQQGVKTPGEWTTQDKSAFVNAWECLASTDSSVLGSIIPHLQALVDMEPDHMPALAKVSLRGLRFRFRG